MAKILVAGDAIVITSVMTLEQITTLEKYRPNALCLFDDNKEVIFKVGTSAVPSAGKFGISFNSETKDGNKLACITIAAPDVEDVVKFVADKYGLAIINLNKVEEQVGDALKSVSDQMAEVMKNITLA